MRIAMVGDEFYPAIGGAPAYTMGLGTALAKLGVEPTLFTHAHPGQAEEEEFDGLTVKRLKGFVISRFGRAVSASLAKRLHEYIKFGEFDVVHGQDIYSPMALQSIYSARKRRIPSVLTCHSIHKTAGLWQLIYRPLVVMMCRANRVIVVSDASREFCRVLGVPDRKMEVIQNGVDLSKFNSAADGSRMRTRMGLGSEQLVVSATRLVRRKGTHYLVAAFSKVRKDVPGVKLAIAGRGPEAANLRAQIKGLGIEDSTFMLGSLSHGEVAELMAAANVFVLPSIVESSPLTLLEAMAVGVPVVCPRAGGVSEIIKDEINGLMFPPADVDTLANVITRVLRDEQLAKRLRRSGLKIVREKFSWERAARQTLELYERVREEHAKRGTRH
ncbi:MAG: glycosyltransferase family 4 protein [Candidatus Hadarchaeaceae archaeon]